MNCRVLLVAAVLLAAAPAGGHHWFSANFDARRPFTMTGVVTRFAWRNPHVALYLDVRDARTAAVTSWMMDMGSPNGLARLGWSKDSLEAGDSIVVEGIPSRDGSPIGYAYAITVSATGRRLVAAPPAAPDRAGERGGDPATGR